MIARSIAVRTRAVIEAGSGCTTQAVKTSLLTFLTLTCASLLGSGCLDETCPAADSYFTEPASEREVAFAESVSQTAEFRLPDGGTSMDVRIDVVEADQAERVLRGYCGDSELIGYSATASAVLSTADGSLSLELPVHVLWDADDEDAALGFEGGAFEGAEVDLVSPESEHEGWRVAGIRVSPECYDGDVALTLESWQIAEHCESVQGCSHETWIPIGTVHFTPDQIPDPEYPGEFFWCP